MSRSSTAVRETGRPEIDLLGTGSAERTPGDDVEERFLVVVEHLTNGDGDELGVHGHG